MVPTTGGPPGKGQLNPGREESRPLSRSYKEVLSSKVPKHAREGEVGARGSDRGYGRREVQWNQSYESSHTHGRWSAASQEARRCIGYCWRCRGS